MSVDILVINKKCVLSGVQGRRVGGEQGRAADVPLPRDAGDEARGAGGAGAPPHHRRGVHARARALRAGGAPARAVEQGPRLHLHPAHRLRPRLERAHPHHLRRGRQHRRGRHAG